MYLASFLVLAAAAGNHAHITYIEARTPLVGKPPPPGSPWPKPQEYQTAQFLLQLKPNEFFMASTSTSCDIVSEAIIRYRKLIFPGNTISTPSVHPLLKSLIIKVANPSDCQYPHQDMDESYELRINVKQGAVLFANASWGVLRGLETFSQLVYVDQATNNYFVNETLIKDFPRFKFRGILLDTARHFLPMKTLMQNLDAMAYNKFNVFHWHIVDDQSWPLQMKVFPNLTDAAYHPKLVYSQRDVAELIEYARLRGIRIIPEIDSPGHSQALGKIFPKILTPCYGTKGRGSADYPRFAAYEMLNPMKDYTYDVMQSIISEVIEMFPENYIHLGMDEVYYDCWQSSPEIMKFMDKHDMSQVSQVEQYYVKRTLENVKKLGAQYMIWQDPIDNGVQAARDTLVGVWRSAYAYSWQEYLTSAVRNGYKIVLSAPWYLNYISYGQDWEKFYQVEPLDFPASAKNKQLVIGGEACMWGEYVDATNAISRLWPRASAVGERLWSASSVKDVEEAKYRLDEHRCRMLRRGLPVQPILNGYCGEYDWEVS